MCSAGHPLYAIVNIPPSFSRWYEVPPSAAQEGDSWQQVHDPCSLCLLIRNEEALQTGQHFSLTHCMPAAAPMHHEFVKWTHE